MFNIKQKIILHIDMNSYFASVEQQANPFLRGKSVGVCAYLSDNGIIIASSTEAKQKGIRTGCKVREAKILDPGVILLENELAKYRSTTEKIFNILKEYTDTLEPYSIDEAFLDLTGWAVNLEEARVLARAIQARIKNEVGEWMNSSVGISTTKFLAKFAGDIAPKKSVLVIDENNIDSILKDRELTDAWGINRKTEEKLKTLGIKNLLELKNYSPDNIRRFMGRYGYYLWANLNGLEISSVNQGSKLPKSIGHSYSLKEGHRNQEYLLKVFYKLCEKTGRRLRGLEMEAEGISIEITYFYAKPVHRSFKTSERMFRTEDIFSRVESFFVSQNVLIPVKNLAVSITRLSSVSNQMNIFEDSLGKKNLSLALDKINDKYGEYTVVSGQMFDMDGIARDRIGFRKTMSA